MGRKETREKVFSPGPTIFILPNQEEKAGEKSALTALLHKCPLFPNCQQRRRRQFSNHQLSTTQLSPPQPKNNSKSTQNNLKSTQTHWKIHPKPNSKSTQNKINSKSNKKFTENQLKIKPLTENP